MSVLGQTPPCTRLRCFVLFLQKAAASTEAPPNIPSILRLGKAQVLEGRAQGAVVEEALRLLGQVTTVFLFCLACGLESGRLGTVWFLGTKLALEH